MDALDGRVIGEIGVAIAVERLLRAGFHVAIPIVDDGYDLLAFDGRQHWRLQVKASASRQSRHNARRIRIMHGRKSTAYYHEDHVDAFVAVNLRTNAVMWVPVSATKGRRYLNWSQADKWDDIGILRTIKTQRCRYSRADQRSRNQNGRA